MAFGQPGIGSRNALIRDTSEPATTSAAMVEFQAVALILREPTPESGVLAGRVRECAISIKLVCD
jgi:hypothetical protein